MLVLEPRKVIAFWHWMVIQTCNPIPLLLFSQQTSVISHTHRLSFANAFVVDNLIWSTLAFGGDFPMIGFAAEFKKDNAEYNKSQLMIVLASAQSHRKALGLKKSIIMGATGCRGQVRILFFIGRAITLYVYSTMY